MHPSRDERRGPRAAGGPAPAETAPEATLIPLVAGKPATGGTFVARHEGRVVFVRGAAPGEAVHARILEDPRTAQRARFWRAEAVEVIEPGPDRVASVWPEAGADGVGGADWAHIALPAQRRIATEVVQELFTRAGLTSFPIEDLHVEPAPHDHDGLGWRTRVRFAVDEQGRVGMRGWRSHAVRDVGENPLAADAIRALRIQDWTAPPGTEAIDVAAPTASPVAIVLLGRELDPARVQIPESWGDASVAVSSKQGFTVLRGSGTVTEQVGQHRFTVAANGFWQVHRGAAELLSETVAAELGARSGETVWDLFGGVGLFTAVAADQVGESGRVWSVEGDRRASRLAAQNFADLPQVSIGTGDATAWVADQGEPVDRVVLDPPRAGAGLELMGLLLEKVRERIVYVSCDPSTLVRDLVAAEKAGWVMRDVRLYDLYPHTHHIEAVAVLERA